MKDASLKGKQRFSDIRAERVDTVAARRWLLGAAKEAARNEDQALACEGLHMGSSDDKVASYRGVGLGLYFKLLHWLFWMMIWMMLCSVPYLITINTSVFTDYAHRHDHQFGVKVYESVQLSSLTFAAILDNRLDNGTLQYMNTEIADAWKGPMRKGVFLTWISLVDAGATVVLTGVVMLLFFLVDGWLLRVDRKTREVADYSVIVGGLPPDVTATEVGEYFERHFSRDPRVDKVMDVVLVRGFSSVVKACKEVHKYEQLKRFVANLESRASLKERPSALPPVDNTTLPVSSPARTPTVHSMTRSNPSSSRKQPQQQDPQHQDRQVAEQDRVLEEEYVVLEERVRVEEEERLTRQGIVDAAAVAAAARSGNAPPSSVSGRSSNSAKGVRAHAVCGDGGGDGGDSSDGGGQSLGEAILTCSSLNPSDGGSGGSAVSGTIGHHPHQDGCGAVAGGSAAGGNINTSCGGSSSSTGSGNSQASRDGDVDFNVDVAAASVSGAPAVAAAGPVSRTPSKAPLAASSDGSTTPSSRATSVHRTPSKIPRSPAAVTPVKSVTSPRGSTPTKANTTATPPGTPSKASTTGSANSLPRVVAATPSKTAIGMVPSASATPSKTGMVIPSAAATPSRTGSKVLVTPCKSSGPVVPVTVTASAAFEAAPGEAEDGGLDPEAGAPPTQVHPAATKSVDMTRELRKVASRIAEQRELVERSVEEGSLISRAALVTFNTEAMKAHVCHALPSGWWSAWFMHRSLQLEHGGRRWRLWVRKAAAPDDYRFENLATRIRTNMLIQVVTGAIMFGFVVVCAAFITWLSAKSSKDARTPNWEQDEMTAAIGIGMAKLTSANVSTAGLSLSAYESFCASVMPTCASTENDKFPAAGINMTYGSEWQFPNATARLLNERPLRQDLQQCAESVSCASSYCLPCYCLGLSGLPTDDASAEFLTHMHDTCSAYWAPYNLRRDGLKVAISFVIAIINALLTLLLRVLKFNIEKHWTTTDTELSFAVWAYLVKLVNSVAVLLIVNCSTLRNLQKRALDHEARWLQNLILNGLYADFTPEWYTSVGFSVQILMMINVAGPLIRSAVDAAVKAVMRARLRCLHCGGLGAPEDYNTAFRSTQFTLEIRISDVLFNLTLALLFGSGMPLCYLIAAVYLVMCLWWDRLLLLTLGQPAQRYQKHLPRFIMLILPVLLAAHCAFGLWMHTYFKAEMAHMDLVGAASNGNANINSLTKNTVAARITQPNGLALLIWFVALAVWIAFGRWIIWGTLKCLGRSCARLTTFIRTAGRGGGEDDSGCSDVTYEEALSTVKVAHMLRGARTYRIHHLPAYKPFLTAGEAGRLWAAAQGEQRFTRLTTFRVCVELEVVDGHRSRTEHREVEMFDVSQDPITSATAGTASARFPAPPPSTLSLPSPTPFSARAAAAAAAAAAGSADRLTPVSTAAPSITSIAPSAAASSSSGAVHPLASARFSMQPSEALKAAALQQVATLEANNAGLLVKRVSLRAVPQPCPTSCAASVVDSEEDGVAVAPVRAEGPEYELELRPSVEVAAAVAAATAAASAAAASAAAIGVRSGAQLSSVPSAMATVFPPPALVPRTAVGTPTKHHHHHRHRFSGGSPAKPPPHPLSLPSASSVPIFKLVLDRSPSAASSQHTIASVKSAPATSSGATTAAAAAAATAAGGFGNKAGAITADEVAKARSGSPGGERYKSKIPTLTTTTPVAATAAANTTATITGSLGTGTGTVTTVDDRADDSSLTLGSASGSETAKTVASDDSSNKAPSGIGKDKANVSVGEAPEEEKEEEEANKKVGPLTPGFTAPGSPVAPAKAVSSVLLKGGRSGSAGSGCGSVSGSQKGDGSLKGAKAWVDGSGGRAGVPPVWIPVMKPNS